MSGHDNICKSHDVRQMPTEFEYERGQLERQLGPPSLMITLHHLDSGAPLSRWLLSFSVAVVSDGGYSDQGMEEGAWLCRLWLCIA
jgi:hypothetical protein